MGWALDLLERRRYDPDQPREPKGSENGGRWTAAGGAGGSAPWGPEDPAARVANHRALVPSETNKWETERQLKQRVAKDLAARMHRAGLTDDQILDAALDVDRDERGGAGYLDQHGYIDAINARGEGGILLRNQVTGDVLVAEAGADEEWGGRQELAKWYGDSYVVNPDAKGKWDVVDLDSEDGATILREGATAALVAKWAKTSNDHDAGALAIQDAVRAEFRLTGTAEWRVDEKVYSAEVLREDTAAITAKHGPALRVFARAQYDASQEMLRGFGIERVTLYRGYGGSRDGEMPRRIVAETALRPASSWATVPDAAVRFADGSPTGAVLTTTVDAARILATPRTGVGCYGEAEVVILGGDLTATRTAVRTFQAEMTGGAVAP